VVVAGIAGKSGIEAGIPPPPVLTGGVEAGIPVLTEVGIPVLTVDGIPVFTDEGMPVLTVEGIPALTEEGMPVLTEVGMPALVVPEGGNPSLKLGSLPAVLVAAVLFILLEPWPGKVAGLLAVL